MRNFGSHWNHSVSRNRCISVPCFSAMQQEAPKASPKEAAIWYRRRVRGRCPMCTHVKNHLQHRSWLTNSGSWSSPSWKKKRRNIYKGCSWNKCLSFENTAKNGITFESEYKKPFQYRRTKRRHLQGPYSRKTNFAKN